MDLHNYTVRPVVGTLQVTVICKRCRGQVRDAGLAGGLLTLGTLNAAAEGHEKRMHRPKLLQGVPA